MRPCVVAMLLWKSVTLLCLVLWGTNIVMGGWDFTMNNIILCCCLACPKDPQ